jgi:hypothetical protein
VIERCHCVIGESVYRVKGSPYRAIGVIDEIGMSGYRRCLGIAIAAVTRSNTPLRAPRQSRLFTAHLYPTPQRTDRSVVVKFSRMFDLVD